MKNADYWAGRMERLNENLMQKADALLPDIQKAYETAAENIQQQIEAFYQRYAGQEGISLAEAKRLLAPKERQRFGMTIEGYIKAAEQGTADPKWIKQLERTAARARVSRLEALRLQMRQQIELLEGWKDMAMTRTLGEIFQECFYQTGYEIQRGLGVGAAFATLDAEKIGKVLARPWSPDGKNFSARIWGDDRAKLLHTLETTVTTGIIIGESPQRTIDKVRKAMGTSRAAAGRLVLTEGAAFSAMGRKECYERLGVKQFAFLATLDAKTCGVCADMDGQVFDLEDYTVGVTAPPLHPFDRCTTVPYFDDEFTEKNMRAARDGEVYYIPADLTYGEWKKAFAEGDKSGFRMFELRGMAHWTRRNKSDKIEIRLGELITAYGKQHGDAISGYLSKASLAIQRVWNDCAGDFHCIEPKYKGSMAFYSPNHDGVKLDISAAAKGSRYQTPYQVVFHEYGHHADYILNRRYGDGSRIRAISETYKNGILGKTVKKEANKAIEEFAANNHYALKNGRVTDKAIRAFCEHIKNELSLLQRADISDMFEPIMPGSFAFPFGIGHGTDYWKIRDNGKEAFAEIYSASVCNPESLEQIKRFFPESYQIFLEILEVVK